jgi:DNA-binding MarR family transcriptional regulator
MYRLEYPINVQRLWCKEKNNNPQNRETIRSLMNKFEQTGSILNIVPSGRSVSVTGQTTEDEVSSILEKEPPTSARQMSLQLNISKSSVLRVYKSMEYKPHIPRLIHELNENDFDRRVE